MEDWTVNHLQKQIDTLSLRLTNAENKLHLAEAKAIKALSMLATVSKFMDTQVELNKMIKV